ncbi:ATP-binding cassette domain-containing protein [Staphylococcus succinus]|uniref:ATP-binding cassette domain-containing protein n=1 Tax=Staphylococcus TaxID=1279 RepID=UPI00062B3A64|nr:MULTISPECIES: ATP-binding cassette domain-containing protein [Staphylococcus]MDH9161462.1 ATP-binding cassette domain-containing protein [Staphylococcus succinus]MEB8125440.1 ATP-binding cassette domain-containing protein [Staphylococcus succinus]OIJ29243.1 teichoic acid ABC transporter ATP-binding protein [Staphylococcus sp. LCT-H4]PNZ16753.1 teichoic acid ABC transporter ATP-binding protein [Staphylococcus succinus subsp. succinus]
MGSSIILKLLNVTHYYRNKKSKKWYLPFGYDAEDIELNNINLHIYQGEALGIIGEPESSKELIGRLLSGEIKPDKGRIVRKKDLFFADIEDKLLQVDTVEDYIANVVTLFPYKTSDHKNEQILKYAHLQEKSQVQIRHLSDAEYAQLLFTLARTSKATVVILNQVLQHLEDYYFEKAIALSDEYINNQLTIVMIDDNVQRIAQASNYLAWISHGQLRMEGSLKQILPIFNDHEKDRLSLTSDEEKANFDVDWKKTRTRVPELTYNFKRTERYNHVKPPVALVRFWTFFIACFVGLVLMALLIFNDIGKLEIGQNIDQATIQNQHKNPYQEKLGYGIVLEDSINLENMDDHKKINIGKYAFMTIVGENNKNYKITIDNKNYKVAKNKIRYFNPAGLYEAHSVKSLAPYMHNNYSNYNEFFNSHLHKKHNKVTESLVPENDKDNRFVVPIVQQPISMLFNDKNKLAGFTIPIKDKDKLKDEFNIDSKFWITKSGDGYFMADLKNNQWIYIEL